MNADNKYLNRVGAFLTKYYHDERHDIQANIHALEELNAADARARGLLAFAFLRVLNDEFPPGTLRDLVSEKANRNVDSDEAAKGVLWDIYNRNMFEYYIEVDD